MPCHAVPCRAVLCCAGVAPCCVLGEVLGWAARVGGACGRGAPPLPARPETPQPPDRRTVQIMDYSMLLGIHYRNRPGGERLIDNAARSSNFAEVSQPRPYNRVYRHRSQRQ
jgi:hypothetical protein